VPPQTQSQESLRFRPGEEKWRGEERRKWCHPKRRRACGTGFALGREWTGASALGESLGELEKEEGKGAVILTKATPALTPTDRNLAPGSALMFPSTRQCEGLTKA
jgi:hypothetical protein